MKQKIKEEQTIGVSSEIGALKKVLVHSPDGGIGLVPTNKLHEWLYDDIVDVGRLQEEYERFQILLLLFLDIKALFTKDGNLTLGKEKRRTGVRSLQNNPTKPGYYVKEEDIYKAKVIDTQFLLQHLFKKFPEQAKELILAICSMEGVHNERKNDLLQILNAGKQESKFYTEVVKALLTGKLTYEYDDGLNQLRGDEIRYIFPPIPNFIFTRDIGISIGNYLLITKPKFHIRKRETILMRFIAEHFLFPSLKEHYKILDVSEDDDYFREDAHEQKQKCVTYEGGDIMVVSKRHLLIGFSERTSAYAIQKLVNRIFWEDIKTGADSEIDTISVIKISEKRSQMHIDTILSHVRQDVWIIHSPLSEEWQKEQQEKERFEKKYLDDLMQKSEEEIYKEKGVVIFQFYLNEEGKKVKKQYINNPSTDEEKKNNKLAKSQFKKIDFLLKAEKQNGIYINCEKGCPYKNQPEGLQDLLTQISKQEYGMKSVKFIYSAGGDISHEGREQWTDACNLLVLRPGVAIGYDRNYKTAREFNSKFKNEPVSDNKEFIQFITVRNKQRFRSKPGDEPLDHIFHVHDLIDYLISKNLNLGKTTELIDSIKNTLILIPSNELSRARGGSHCMSMPLIRENP